MEYQARISLIAGLGNPARFQSAGVAVVPSGLTGQSRKSGVMHSPAVKWFLQMVFAAMALMAVQLVSVQAATVTYAILFDQTDALSYPPNPCGADHCGLFSFDTGGLPDGVPVSSFAADFAFFDTRVPSPGPPEIFWNPRTPSPGPPDSPFVVIGMFLEGMFSEGDWTLTLLSDGGWQADWEYEPDKVARFEGTYSVEPVPLPAALPLFAAGLSAMGFMGWRRRKAAVAG